MALSNYMKKAIKTIMGEVWGEQFADAFDAKLEAASLRASTLAARITGYSSTTGAISAASTVLGAINRLNGNTALKQATSGVPAAVLATPITGFASGAGAVAAADTVLQAVNKLDGNIALKQATSGVPAAVLATPITGFASGAGAVAAVDTVLQAVNKLDGNTALKQGALTWNVATSDAVGVISVPGMTATGSLIVVPLEEPGVNFAMSYVVPGVASAVVHCRNTNSNADELLNAKKVGYIVVTVV